MQKYFRPASPGRSLRSLGNIFCKDSLRESLHDGEFINSIEKIIKDDRYVGKQFEKFRKTFFKADQNNKGLISIDQFRLLFISVKKLSLHISNMYITSVSVFMKSHHPFVYYSLLNQAEKTPIFSHNFFSNSTTGCLITEVSKV